MVEWGVTRGHGVLWGGGSAAGPGRLWGDLALGAPVEVRVGVRCFRVLWGLGGVRPGVGDPQ